MTPIEIFCGIIAVCSFVTSVCGFLCYKILARECK